MNEDNKLLYQLFTSLIVFFGAIALIEIYFAGCSYPTKNQYKRLLHQCRESNRECRYKMKPCREEVDENGAVILICPQSIGGRNLGS